MGYRKVYYNEMWEIIDNIAALTHEWIEDKDAISASVENLKNSSYIKGDGADNIIAYMEDIHGLVLQLINDLFFDLLERTETYRGKYQSEVDGGQSDYNKIYTTMVRDELEHGGEVSRNIDSMLNLNSEIKWEVNRARSMVQDLVWLDYPSYTDSIEEALNYAKEIATNLNDKIESYEQGQAEIFDDFDTLLNEIRSIICYQLSVTRVPMASYVKNQWQTMCDAHKLSVAATSIENDIADLEDDYKESLKNTFNREELLKQEREDEVKWIRWVATGVCIVASVAVTIACPAAGPIMLGVVGAATKTVSGITNELCDQYVETGFENGVDWSELGKVAVVSAGTGFVGGYLGGVIGGGSTAQTFIKKAGQEVGKNLIESGVESGISTAWDIGEGLINGEVDDIHDVVDIVSDELKDLGENAVGDVITGIVGTAFDDVIEWGDDKIFKDIKDGIGKDIGKATYSTVTDVVGDAFKNVPADIGKEVYNVIVRDEEFNINDVTDNFKENFSAEKLVENGLGGFVKNIAKESFVDSDKKFSDQMKNEAGKDGKVDMVQFEDGTTVLKKDYDAAREMAKDATILDREIGSKRNKNAREILGVRTTQGATDIKVDPDKITKADYKGKSKIDKYDISK